MSKKIKPVSLTVIAVMGREDAFDAYVESGSTQTPDGGWDSWLINGIGVDETCKRFGENPEESADGWSDRMKLKLETYHKAAVEHMKLIDLEEHISGSDDDSDE